MSVLEFFIGIVCEGKTPQNAGTALIYTSAKVQ
jgi:hypothetical protein